MIMGSCYLNQVLRLLWFHYDLLRFGTGWWRRQWWQFLQLNHHLLGSSFLGQLFTAAVAFFIQMATSAQRHVRSHVRWARLFDKLLHS